MDVPFFFAEKSKSRVAEATLCNEKSINQNT